MGFYTFTKNVETTLTRSTQLHKGNAFLDIVLYFVQSEEGMTSEVIKSNTVHVIVCFTQYN